MLTTPTMPIRSRIAVIFAALLVLAAVAGCESARHTIAPIIPPGYCEKHQAWLNGDFELTWETSDDIYARALGQTPSSSGRPPYLVLWNTETGTRAPVRDVDWFPMWHAVAIADEAQALDYLLFCASWVRAGCLEGRTLRYVPLAVTDDNRSFSAADYFTAEGVAQLGITDPVVTRIPCGFLVTYTGFVLDEQFMVRVPSKLYTVEAMVCPDGYVSVAVNNERPIPPAAVIPAFRGL